MRHHPADTYLSTFNLTDNQKKPLKIKSRKSKLFIYLKGFICFKNIITYFKKLMIFLVLKKAMDMPPMSKEKK